MIEYVRCRNCDALTNLEYLKNCLKEITLFVQDAKWYDYTCPACGSLTTSRLFKHYLK